MWPTVWPFANANSSFDPTKRLSELENTNLLNFHFLIEVFNVRPTKKAEKLFAVAVGRTHKNTNQQKASVSPFV